MSNTFILREIRALRQLGVTVVAFSIRRASAIDLLADVDRDEARQTLAVRPASLGRIAAAHARAIGLHPLRYVATLALALRLRPAGLRGLVWQVFYFVEAILVWNDCRRLRVRHLHAHFGNVACDVSLLAAHFGDGQGGRWSYSFTVHGPTEFYELTRNRLAEKADRAAMVVCISRFARSQVLALLPRAEWAKVVIVHCGISPAAFSMPRQTRARVGPTRVLCVGRLVPVKGQAILLDAVAALTAQSHDVEVAFVGEGPDRPHLESVIAELGLADRVRLVGAVGQDAIAPFYAAADIFCLPSFAEGLPVVLMEAMAARLPVVSTTVMGIPELIDDETNGLLVAPADPAALADALMRLVDDPALCTRLSDAAYRAVSAEFDVDRSARALRALFAEMPGVGAEPEPDTASSA